MSIVKPHQNNLHHCILCWSSMIEDHQATLLQSSGTKRTSSNDNSLRPLVEYWGMAGDDVKNRPQIAHWAESAWQRKGIGNSPSAVEDDAKIIPCLTFWESQFAISFPARLAHFTVFFPGNFIQPYLNKQSKLTWCSTRKTTNGIEVLTWLESLRLKTHIPLFWGAMSTKIWSGSPHAKTSCWNPWEFVAFEKEHIQVSYYIHFPHHYHDHRPSYS